MAGKKTVYNGIVFDSMFEAAVYKKLKDEDINITGVHPEFILFDDFKYTDMNGKIHKVRNMKYTGDIQVEVPSLNKPLIIESKNGIITGEYLIRRKLFLMKYSDRYYFQQINSISELMDLIDKLKGE